MDNLEKSILQTLIFYDILEKPLTALEIFRYLPVQNRLVSFFELKQVLANSPEIKKLTEESRGLYFLSGQADLIEKREKRIKESQLKLKKLKEISWVLFFVPFLKMAALTGSLTLQNAKMSSDFDLLVVVKEGRLWTSRAFLILITQILGLRRYGQKTRDRFCLNCFLSQKHLKIEKEAKARDFFSAQEYGRLIPILENKPEIARDFFKENRWISEFINFFPWPQNFLSKKEVSYFKKFPVRILEWMLENRLGERLEEKLGSWQSRRINSKLSLSPEDQIFVGSQCLIFHPQSKSEKILRASHQKEKLLINRL